MDQIMTYAADLLLIAASLGAGVFCLILSRRLSRLSRIDNGLGGAIAVLSAQVDDMSKALAETKEGSEGSATRLEALNTEARVLLEELELMISACHDVGPDPAGSQPPEMAEEEVREPVITFGSRRHSTEEEDATVPLFLKSKSRLAGLG